MGARRQATLTQAYDSASCAAGSSVCLLVGLVRRRSEASGGKCWSMVERSVKELNATSACSASGIFAASFGVCKIDGGSFGVVGGIDALSWNSDSATDIFPLTNHKRCTLLRDGSPPVWLILTPSKKQ